MGSDNLFHKRRKKNARDLARKQARRSPYDRVLIVCEGTKTEPIYFTELRDCYSLNTANIEVTGESGSSPSAILNFAKRRYKESKQERNEFDKIYCVFDKDNHTTYDQTVNDIRSFKPGNKFFAITSVPCFEFWLLLHFVHTDQPFNSQPGNSAAKQVLTRLHQHLQDYRKGGRGLFKRLLPRLEQAKNRATGISEKNVAAGSDNPSTKVQELVEYLQNLKTSLKI